MKQIKVSPHWENEKRKTAHRGDEGFPSWQTSLSYPSPKGLKDKEQFLPNSYNNSSALQPPGNHEAPFALSKQ